MWKCPELTIVEVGKYAFASDFAHPPRAVWRFHRTRASQLKDIKAVLIPKTEAEPTGKSLNDHGLRGFL
jgi:hypothetical protein